MPELPEVETVVRDLRPLLVGQTIAKVTVGPNKLRRAWDKKWTRRLLNQIVTAIRRRGKWIIVELDSGECLLVHLGMTGQFTIGESSAELLNHTHLVFDLRDGLKQLRFRDPRRFGSVDLFANVADVELFLNERLGPEPTDVESVYFRERLSKTARTLKAILLDQTVIAGVGNIYADEALHQSKIHPERRGNSLTKPAIERLRQAIVTVIEFAIECRGSTIRDYIGGSGLKGGFQNEFQAYGRTGIALPKVRHRDCNGSRGRACIALLPEVPTVENSIVSDSNSHPLGSRVGIMSDLGMVKEVQRGIIVGTLVE